jgi:hypothetical protein
LPAALDKTAAALSLSERKDKAGAKLMRRLANADHTPTPEELAALTQYCKVDVLVERAIHARIGLLDTAEQAVWELDQCINDRGD